MKRVSVNFNTGYRPITLLAWDRFAAYLAAGEYDAAADELRSVFSSLPEEVRPTVTLEASDDAVVITVSTGDGEVKVTGTPSGWLLENARVTVRSQDLELTFSFDRVESATIYATLESVGRILETVSVLASERFEVVASVGNTVFLAKKQLPSAGNRPATAKATVTLTPGLYPLTISLSVPVRGRNGELVWETDRITSGRELRDSLRTLLLKHIISEVEHTYSKRAAATFRWALVKMAEVLQVSEEQKRLLERSPDVNVPKPVVTATEIKVDGFDIYQPLTVVASLFDDRDAPWGAWALAHAVARFVAWSAYTEEDIERLLSGPIPFDSIPPTLAAALTVREGLPETPLSPVDAYELLRDADPAVRDDDLMYLRLLYTVCEHNSKWCTELVLKDPELSGGVEWTREGDMFFVMGHRVWVRAFDPPKFLTVIVDGKEVRAVSVKGAINRLYLEEEGLYA